MPAFLLPTDVALATARGVPLEHHRLIGDVARRKRAGPRRSTGTPSVPYLSPLSASLQGVVDLRSGNELEPR